jgi:flagellar protein FliS
MKDKAAQYLQARIMTATKEELLLLLFDGAIKFAQQAKAKLKEGNREEKCKLLIRSQKIVIELMSSLRKDVLSQELYSNLIGLYGFIYMRLVDANLSDDQVKIEEALQILNSLRQTWAEAIEKNKKERLDQLNLVKEDQKSRPEKGSS